MSYEDYNILGLKYKENDTNLIKQAYKTAALKYHPDKNRNDPEMTEKFKKVNQAYENISKSNTDINILVDHFFGFINKFSGNSKEDQHSKHVLIDVNVTLENLYCGTECLIKYKRKVIDPTISNEFCKECNGYGYITQTRNINDLSVFHNNKECEVCKMSGFTGKLMYEYKQLNIVIKPGTMDDEKIIYEKMGNQSLDGTYGDLIVQLVNFEHHIFKRKEDDLYMDLNITFKEALLGFERKIQFLNNKYIKITHSKVISIGKIIILKGYGMNSKSCLFVNVFFEMPKKLTDEQKEIISKQF